MDFIIVLGAPGVGKSTVSKIIAKKLGSPYFELSRLREIHLLPDWSNASREEEKVSFAQAMMILKNYKLNGYKNVVFNDLDDIRVPELPKALRGHRYLLVTLFVSDEKELKRRILIPSDDRGFRRYDAAIQWNRMVMARRPFAGELRIDSSKYRPDGIVAMVLKAARQSRIKSELKFRPRISEFFDQFEYFKNNAVPPWSNKVLSKTDVNKGWKRALKGKKYA